MKVALGLFLLVFIIIVAYHLDLETGYYSGVLVKEKNGKVYLDIWKQEKKILAYKILKNKIIFMFLHGRKELGRRSFYCAEKPLEAMRNLLINKYKIPELEIDEEMLNNKIQKWNADAEILYLAKQKLLKHSSVRRVYRVFNKNNEPLIDLKHTFPRTIERMKIVIDLLWKNKAKSEDILFQLAFKEIMASDICHKREEMSLFKKILSIEERL